MPSTFSKPISHETSPIRHACEEPISLSVQRDKASSVQPKEVQIMLQQDPMDPNSDEISKTFTKFVVTTQEAYCQRMCNMELYI
jgi:hypothetical protein